MNDKKEGLIATKLERLRFWTAVMRDERESTTVRLKASEMMAKVMDDFCDGYAVEHLGSEVMMTNDALARIASMSVENL